MSTTTTSAVTLEDLLSIGKNRDNFCRLEEQVRMPLGVVPFVGAGLSIPCGLHGWERFLLEEAGTIEKQGEVTEHLRRGEYEEAAELLARELGARAFADALDSHFGPRRLATVELRGPVLRVPSLGRGPVLTTNFDRVLEISFERAGLPFLERVWGAKPDLFAQALHENRRYLLKIHGDVVERTERVLTLQDYERHYGNGDIAGVDLSRPLPKVLEQTFTTRTVLFIGCSLTQDRTLRLLKRVAKAHGAPPPHYAIVPRPKSSSEASQRGRFLGDHNIRPLWFPEGQYEAVDVFLSALEQVAGRLAGPPTTNPGSVSLTRGQRSSAADRIPRFQETRLQCEKIEAAQLRRQKLCDNGLSTAAVNAEIVNSRRQLREGGELPHRPFPWPPPAYVATGGAVLMFAMLAGVVFSVFQLLRPPLLITRSESNEALCKVSLNHVSGPLILCSNTNIVSASPKSKTSDAIKVVDNALTLTATTNPAVVTIRCDQKSQLYEVDCDGHVTQVAPVH